MGGHGLSTLQCWHGTGWQVDAICWQIVETPKHQPNQTKPNHIKPMNTQAILETKNWTGLTFAELCEAGRIGSRATVTNWVNDCINEAYRELTWQERNQTDCRKMLADREQMISEICARFDIA